MVRGGAALGFGIGRDTCRHASRVSELLIGRVKLSLEIREPGLGGVREICENQKEKGINE